MATEIDLFFSYGDDSSDPISGDVPAEIDQPVLNRLDRQRHEYRGQMIEKVKGGFQVEGDDARQRTIFHATSRIDELHQAAFDPHVTKLGSGSYELAGQRIERIGRKWQVGSTGQLFKTLTEATQNVAQNIRERFTNPTFQESVGYIPAENRNVETTANLPTNPSLIKHKAGSYSFGGVDILKDKSKWMVGDQAHPSLAKAVESIQSIFDAAQPRSFTIDTDTGSQPSFDFKAFSTGLGGQRPFVVDAFTRVGGSAGNVNYSLRDYENPQPIDISGILDPNSIRPPSPMNNPRSPASNALDPIGQVNAYVTTQSPADEFRERKYGLLKELSDRSREGTRAFADQQSLIASNFKQHRSDIRGQMREIQAGAAGRRQGLYGIFSNLGIPGYVGASITDRTLFTNEEQQRIKYHREALRNIESQYIEKRQDLRDKRHEFRQQIADTRYAYRGANMLNPVGLNQPIPAVPNFNPNFAPPNVGPNPAQGAGGGGGLAGILQGLGGGGGAGGAAFLNNLALIGAVIGIASVAAQKVKRIGSAFGEVAQQGITGLADDDPVKYYIEGSKRKHQLMSELDMTGNMKMVEGMNDMRLSVLATIEQHTRYITQKMGAFAPQTMYQSIEDRLRVFEADIENASRIDPTVASINSAKTDTLIAMRELKTSLVDTFGSSLVNALDILTLMLAALKTLVDLLNIVIEFLKGLVWWVPDVIALIRRSRQAAQTKTAEEIQDQIRDFFGTK